MNIATIEATLSLRFPDEHRRILLSPSDPIHERCDFLVPDSPYELLDIVRVNERLHRVDDWDPWPDYLVAFASNGCHDYFAYDLRADATRIIYIDPDHTVVENLNTPDALIFNSFEAWYASRFKRNG